jgi:hypothetical protein
MNYLKTLSRRFNLSDTRTGPNWNLIWKMRPPGGDRYGLFKDLLAHRGSLKEPGQYGTLKRF